MKDAYLPRKCIQIEATSSPIVREVESLALEAYRQEDAYILLGSPGAGKTDAFKFEAEQTENGCYLKVRNLLTFEDKPEWRNQVLFIDGLDELTEGFATQSNVDKIRSILYNLGKPKFRLACRSADWLQADDLRYFEDVSPTGNVSVLLLAPLTDDDIFSILNRHGNFSESKMLLEKATQNNIYDILKNPLNLKLFAELPKSDDLPDSRTDIYARICALLLKEASPPSFYRAARRKIEHYIKLAGKLFAYLLLSGHRGFCLKEGIYEDYLYLGEITDEHWDDLLQVLNSRLFELTEGDCFEPIHSQVAEFLAAKFTTNLIDSGLPYPRIISHISCEYIGISQPFRGLAAWLASLNSSVRNDIISRVPLSVALYGDVKRFSDDEKNRILEILSNPEHTNEWVFYATDEYQLRNLVTTDFVKKLKINLELAIGARVAELNFSFQLSVLKHANQNSEIRRILFEIVRHNQIDDTARTFALEALTYQKNQDSVDEELWNLFQDVLVEKVADPQDELLATLLEYFYPERISASEIVVYLKPRKRHFLNDKYQLFWIHGVCEVSTPQQLEIILDTLVEQKTDSGEASESEVHHFDSLPLLFPLRVLKKYLEKVKEVPPMMQLFKWLGTASGFGTTDYNPIFGTQERRRIRTWIENNPNVRESINEIGVQECLASFEHPSVDSFRSCMNQQFERRLFDAKPPAEYGLWCLNQAKKSDSSVVAEYFIHQVAEFAYYRRCNKGLSRNSVNKKLSKDKHLLKLFDRRLSELSANDSRNNVWQKKQEEELAKVKSELSRTINDSKEQILQNKGRIDLLHQLAMIYFGRYDSYSGNNPDERIKQVVGDSTELVEVVTEGFKSTVQRIDIPNHNEILRAHSQSKYNLLGLPFLAGLNEVHRTEGISNFRLNERQLRQALAFFLIEHPLSTDDFLDHLPCWFEHALSTKPETVAEMLVAFERANWINSRVAPKFTFELAYVSKFKLVATHASVPLLKAFPVRCPNNQLIHLGLLLKSALMQCEVSVVQEIINKKIALKSMTIAQLGYWLIAGLTALPDEFLAHVESYTSKNESRIRYLTDAIKILVNSSIVRDTRSTQVLGFLIGILGVRYSPPIFEPKDGQEHHQHEDFDGSILVQELISRLASISTLDATNWLETLVSDNRLDLWKRQIEVTLTRQKLNLQESQFEFSRIEDIRQLFQNSEPGSVKDLNTISIEYIEQLGEEIRCNSTSDWRQYWNVDQFSRPDKPKPENACRDTFVSDLKHRLNRRNVHVETEARHTNDNRSDIRITFGEYSIPVEIKCSSNTELWTAGMEQLRDKYAIDPSSSRYGIYLVFWFGIEHLRKPPQKLNIGTPKNALGLKTSLQRILSTEGVEKISICVIDVTQPKNHLKSR